MDVVKRNITALNGSVEIDSAEGYGMSVKVRLPLTLAIMDGMSVGVGPECYILPLSSVVESFQVEPGMIRELRSDGNAVASVIHLATGNRRMILVAAAPTIARTIRRACAASSTATSNG